MILTRAISPSRIRAHWSLTLLLPLAAATACGQKSIEQVETTAVVSVVVETAKVDLLQGTVVATGVVTPAPGADITIVAPEAARISELPKAEGDSVNIGDVLVRFDIPTLAVDVAARRAAVKQVAARVEAAKANFTRLSALLAQGVAAPREVEDAKRQQAEAEADVEQAKSAVDAAIVLSDRAVVRATFAGVVAKRFHNPGDVVESSASDPILRVINLAQLQVVAAVPVSEFSRVVVGHVAHIRSAGSADAEPATVLAKAPQIDAANASASVRLMFKKPTTLAAGTVVQVEIIAEERPQVVVIPVAALVTEEGELFVMVAGDDNKAHQHPVAVGLSTRTMTEVTSGIKAGDKVIVRGQDGLPEGAAVAIESK